MLYTHMRLTIIIQMTVGIIVIVSLLATATSSSSSFYFSRIRYFFTLYLIASKYALGKTIFSNFLTENMRMTSNNFKTIWRVCLSWIAYR